MAIPTRQNILLYQGDTLLVNFDAQGHDIDSIRGLVRTHSSSPKVLAVFDIEQDGEDGLLGSLGAQQTSKLPRVSVYDIEATLADGTVKTIAYGRIRAIGEVTRD